MSSLLKKVLRNFIVFPLKKLDFIDVYSARSFFNNHPIIFGDPRRIKIGKDVHLYNAILNTNSGMIVIEDYVTLKPNSMLITGTHDFSTRDLKRRDTYPRNGRDIMIRKGAWIGPGAIVLGKVTIGESSVIGAGSVVTKDVEAYCVAVGNPARVIRKLAPDESGDASQNSFNSI
jgi:acetyltransferase-like isoleucine patch superfamily enzyme